MLKPEVLKSIAQGLNKYEHSVIKDEDKIHILLGTPLAFDEDVEQIVINAYKKMKELLCVLETDVTFDEPDVYDYVSSPRDELIEYFCKAINADITYGYEEF